MRFTPTSVGTTSPLVVALSNVKRFTPTSVGTTDDHEKFISLRKRFTPTSVGTTVPRISNRVTVHGSPPRAWGQLGVSLRIWDQYIGSPPRAWGQQKVLSGEPEPENGSPPRAWGQRTSARSLIALPKRFTPTSVGTTNELDCTRIDIARFTPTSVGTTLLPCMRLLLSTRFTPTSVGTTHAHSKIALANQAVHPHERGDNDRALSQRDLLNYGSPPRAWGQRMGRS